MNDHERKEMISAKDKTCEWCGKRSRDCQYFFLSECHLAIFLKSRRIVAHDPARETVRLDTGQQIEYDMLRGDHAYVLKPRLIPHILCGEACALEIMSTKLTLAPSAIDAIGVFDCTNKSMPLWIPIVNGASNVRFEKSTCSHCRRSFPNVHKSFTTIQIRETKVAPGRHGAFVQPPGWDVSISDTNEVKPNGRYWLLKTSQSPDNSQHFCSNECAFDHAKSKNALVVFPNIVLNGFMTVTSPFTMEINSALGNKSAYRPTKLMPLP